MKIYKQHQGTCGKTEVTTETLHNLKAKMFNNQCANPRAQFIDLN